MTDSGKSDDSRGGPPLFRSAITWLLTLGGTTLASVIRTGSFAGVSRLLAIAYLFTVIALLLRHLTHIYEGYYQAGLWRSMLAELATLILWGLCAVFLIGARDPQIPRLLLCPSLAALAFFFCATRMEEARAALSAERRAPIKRATDVLRGSGAWHELCHRFSQIDFEIARRVRRFFAGEDSRAGNLSLAAALALLTQVTIALIATVCAIASLIVPLPLTPPHERGGGGSRGGSPEQVPAGGGTSPSTAAAGPSCPPSYQPGAQIPEPQRQALILGWLPVAGLPAAPMEALGFDIAGCPRPAQRVPGSSGDWYANGYCDGELRAVTIAPPGLSHPVVMLEQAAEFVLPLIEEGEFLDAVDRFAVGDGDAYVIDSRRGSYVLIRDRASNGPVKGGAGGEGCGAYEDQDVRYMIAGPGLIEAWRAVAAITPGGAYPIAYALDRGGREALAFHGSAGIVAEGSCSTSRLSCVVQIGGEEVHGHAGSYIDRAEVETLSGAS